MSASEFDIDSILVNPGFPIEGASISHHSGTNTDVQPAFKEPGYEGAIDYRIRQLSYSSLLTLHTCPRKFELYKKRTTQRSSESETETITFSFGHVVGLGIQLCLEGLPQEAVIWRMFQAWHTADLFAADEKKKKSFWYAVLAIKRFLAMREQGLLEGYELVWYDGKPATELSFCINFGDGFRLRGFVDAVLRNTLTGQVIVLEVKTTGLKFLNPAMYKNSAQAIGYSVVLDVLFPELSSYEVLYLVYQTTSEQFTPIPFVKTYLQRAQWIQELLLDIDTIKSYEDAGIYPMHGESCFNFMRECEYLNSCTLSTEYLTKPCTPAEEDKTEYQVNLSILDLVQVQLEKAGRG